MVLDYWAVTHRPLELEETDVVLYKILLKFISISPVNLLACSYIKFAPLNECCRLVPAYR